MSILIKGMEMPKNCGECKFFAWKRIVGNHCAICDNITLHATLDGLDVNYERNGDCPLIEVPLADVLSVVRCKECRWWNEGYCRLIKYETTDDWFCADGWRKNGE